jgi:hypothetical protein
MGKLAERLADAKRSGIYRVETTEALEEAAALNGFALERVALAGGVRPIRAGDGRVLLFSGGEAGSLNGALAPLIAELAARTEACRSAGERFFAVFLDPGGALRSLPPLYNWQRKQRGG